jgi:hypothetical protein
MVSMLVILLAGAALAWSMKACQIGEVRSVKKERLRMSSPTVRGWTPTRAVA